MKIAVIYGTRPEAIKLAPVILEIQSRPEIDLYIINSGQHSEMTKEVEDIFSFSPDYNLEIMQKNQSLNHIVSSVLDRLDKLFDAIEPDLVIVQGDTSTVLSTGITCFHKKISIAHVEAGLRSNNLEHPFPEEFNRKVLSIIAKYNFAPTILAKENLINEGVPEDNIFITGNTVVDAVHLISSKLRGRTVGNKSNSKKILITAHRRENHGHGISCICNAVKTLINNRKDVEFIWPVHPNPNVHTFVHEELQKVERVHLLPPLSYLELSEELRDCFLIWTDSGGIQEEAPSYKKPVLILRNVTERPEVVTSGFGILTDTNVEKIIKMTNQIIDDEKFYNNMISNDNPFGDGSTANRIVEHILVN